jgi:predicted Rossmann fold flavoprotein
LAEICARQSKRLRDAMANEFDVVVLGGGAAGLMCALVAGYRGRHVVVLENSDRIGKKILISGGGRCNFTNLGCTPENFLSSNPHFCKSALARYTPRDFLAMVERHRIPYHEKTKGQLFCDRSARDIVGMLEAECAKAGVEIRADVRVVSVRRDAGFRVEASAGEFRAQSLVVATGGLSIPKIGATPFGYELAKQFGVKIRPCRPALVPLVWSKQDAAAFADLAGVSTEVTAVSDGASFQDKMLFTHRGLSGPAILQVSSYWELAKAIELDLLPGQDISASLRKRGARRDVSTAKAALRRFLPQRLADRWLALHPPRAWTDNALNTWSNEMHHWRVSPAATEGYEKAEVTAGGIDTDELSSKTMEAKRVPGLYFVGEVVDVTGWLGGYNFQWAWASGVCAGQAA